MRVNHGAVQFVKIEADTSTFEQQMASMVDVMRKLQRAVFEPLIPQMRAAAKVVHELLWLLDGSSTGVWPYGGRWSRWQMKPRRW